MAYVDGFLLPVPKKNLALYKKMAKWGARLWKKHGALQYRECVLDDPKTPCGIPFTKVVKAKPGETVFFSYIVYKSRAHRDKVNKAVMADPAMNVMPKKMPFDPKRMAYGGFRVFVEA